MPSPVRKRNSRREAGRILERGGTLLDIYELVEIHHHIAQIRERRERRIGGALACMVGTLFFEELAAFRHLLGRRLAGESDSVSALNLPRRICPGLLHAL